MGIFRSLGLEYAATKSKQQYKPYKPYIKKYEGGQFADIQRLYHQGYEGDPALGYSAAEMEGQYGQGRDLLAGEEAAGRQRLSDYYRGAGSMGINSAAYGKALQRQDLARISRANDLRRQMIIANAQQKRADLKTRLSAVGAAYGQGVSIYNNYTKGYNQRLRDIWGNAGGAVDSGITAGATYGAA